MVQWARVCEPSSRLTLPLTLMSSRLRLRFASTALAAVALFALHACGGGDGGPTPPASAPVSSIVVTPDAQSITVSQTLQLTATLRDASSNVLTGRSTAWSATPTTNGSVTSTGLVTALAPGVLTITAGSEGKSGSTQITVFSNAPVATVTVTSASPTLIPQGTAQLTAVLKDAAGNTLTGRNITWTATPTTVGSVSPNGVVTAIAPGTLTVAAASEGENANVSLAVISGAVVGPTGGTFTLSGGDVEVVVPAGAVSGSTTITSVPVSQPSVASPAGWQTVGQQYTIGPSGTTFAQPVTVKFKFKSVDLPPFAMSGDLKVRQASASQWTSLSDVVVDAATKTISGRTTTFGTTSSLVTGAHVGLGVVGFGDVLANQAPATNPTIGVSAQDPAVSLAPGRASVNAQQRSVTFIAAIAPNGTGVPLPANTPALMYRWSTTGRNGALSGPSPTQWTTTTSVQYTATVAVLDQLSGPIDDVKVEVLLNPGETDPVKQRIVSATAIVDADLTFSYDILPSAPVIAPSEATNLQLVIRNKEGVVQTLPTAQSLAWTTSGVFGNIGSPLPRQESVTYRANATFSSPPPRVDDVVAKVTEVRSTVTRVFRPAIFGTEGAFDEQTVTRTVDIAEKKAFVEVKVTYQITITPAAKQLAVGGNTTLTASVSPEYDGPGLMYRWTNPGAFGTLNVANGTRTASSSVTYTATANGGTDQVKVDVVSVAAGVELETIGSAVANVEVDSRRLAWRFTSFDLVSYTFTTPTTCVDMCAYLRRLETIPGAGFIFAFPDSTNDPPLPLDPLHPNPGVHLMVTQYDNGDALRVYGPRAGYDIYTLVHRFNGTSETYRPATGTFIYTGDARSGTISGIASPVRTSAIWDTRVTLTAQKSGDELTGDLKVEQWEWRNPSVIISTKLWNFRGVRLP